LVHPGATGASDFRKTFGQALWIVLGVAAGILLIACSNVASLLLARSMARSAEMAMRISLGAGRLRLVRQLLTESLLLSLAAGCLGWLVARVAAPLLVALLSRQDSPVRFALAMDSRVLIFCAVVSTGTAVLFGLLPAWQTSGARPILELRGAHAAANRLRMGRFFVGVQVAFAFCLVMAGATFLFSLRNLVTVNTGFDARGVAVFTLSSTLSDMTEKPALNVLLSQFQSRIAALPTVQGAAMAQGALFDGSHWSSQVILPDHSKTDREEIFYSVSPGYFSTLRTPLLAGRDFAEHDRDYGGSGPRPTIVNQAFSRRYFGDQNPIGKSFQTPDEKSLVSHEIVGVVANSRYGDLRTAPQPIAYSIVRGTNLFTLYVRSPLDLGSLARMVEREALATGNGTRVREITTLDTLVGSTLLREKLLAGVGGVFAFLGLLLAAIGLFGVLNYSVMRRTKEIGIRAALGARPPALILLVLRDLFATVGGGLVVGLAASISLLSLVRSLLFGIEPSDPLVMTTAGALFLAATFVAGWLPANRAASIDPVDALRHE
jgi:putative ABC transport system permease protein